MENRRACRRIPTRDLAELRFITPSSGPDLEDSVVHAVVRDVSAQGMKLRVHIEVPVGAQVEVLYRALRPERSFVHRGRVAWTAKGVEGVVVTHQVGLQLTKVDEGHQGLWDGFLMHGAGLSGTSPFSRN